MRGSGTQCEDLGLRSSEARERSSAPVGEMPGVTAKLLRGRMLHVEESLFNFGQHLEEDDWGLDADSPADGPDSIE
ncbi:MAG TPA: hypothetical protein VL967_00515 [Terracidiphilus sp.]|nr:hypothetical protein [Terracidiphilus sp.]